MKESRMGRKEGPLRGRLMADSFSFFPLFFLVNSPDDGVLQEPPLVPQRRGMSRWLKEGAVITVKAGRRNGLAGRFWPRHVLLVD